MKETKYIVCVMVMLIGVLTISPRGWATSYVWVEETHPDATGRIEFNVDWAVGDPSRDLDQTDVLEFTWTVGGTELHDIIGAWHIYGLRATTSALDTYGTVVRMQIWANAWPDQSTQYLMKGWDPLDPVEWTIYASPHGRIASGHGHWERADTPPIPEPSVLLLLGTSLIGLIALRRTVSHQR